MLASVCTATRDKDFKIARNATLTFDGVDLPPPIGSSANPSVHIEEDSLVEGTEAFLCVLAISVSPGQPLQSSDPDTITITILDVDGRERLKRWCTVNGRRSLSSNCPFCLSVQSWWLSGMMHTIQLPRVTGR